MVLKIKMDKFVIYWCKMNGLQAELLVDVKLLKMVHHTIWVTCKIDQLHGPMDHCPFAMLEDLYVTRERNSKVIVALELISFVQQCRLDLLYHQIH